jgi:Uma2 family endonuclease
MSIAPSPLDAEIETFGEPAWDVARLFPTQGHWSEEEYFSLSNSTNRLVEYSHGYIEVLAMPTMLHQDILVFLFDILRAFAAPGELGKTLFAGMKVQLWTGKYREPDILFMLAEHADRMTNQYWLGADLVMEVVSEDRRHDLEKKRLEYAQARIPEYWIVDPRDQKITVLTLDGDAYVVHGEFIPGEQAPSRLLPGFAVAVAEAFAAKP